MWTTEATVLTQGSADAVWKLWTNVDHWTDWDKAIEYAHLNGPFAVGSEGRLRPCGGPELPFRITSVVPGQSYSDETYLPGAVIRFRHSLLSDEQGVRITHHAEIDGERANEYIVLFGEHIKHGVPAAVQLLAKLAAEGVQR